MRQAPGRSGVYRLGDVASFRSLGADRGNMPRGVPLQLWRVVTSSGGFDGVHHIDDQILRSGKASHGSRCDSSGRTGTYQHLRGGSRRCHQPTWSRHQNVRLTCTHRSAQERTVGVPKDRRVRRGNRWCSSRTESLRPAGRDSVEELRNQSDQKVGPLGYLRASP